MRVFFFTKIKEVPQADALYTTNLSDKVPCLEMS